MDVAKPGRARGPLRGTATCPCYAEISFPIRTEPYKELGSRDFRMSSRCGRLIKCLNVLDVFTREVVAIVVVRVVNVDGTMETMERLRRFDSGSQQHAEPKR